jgi:MurNAc alpha-1-phosphate uridylyltransferase
LNCLDLMTATRFKPLEITHGMVLAAGFGKRMQPITNTLPKPLVTVDDRALLDRALDHFATAGISDVVVNAHYLGEQIHAHLENRDTPRIVISDESEILETGGGVLQALALLGSEPFAVANSDALWGDGPTPALARMAEAWDDGRMDALLLLHSTIDAVGYAGRGDFFMDPDGGLIRRQEGEVAPFLFTGIQILHPRCFEDETPGKFSLNRIYDKALVAGRLFGVRHDGDWYHVGTPEGLAEVEEIFCRPRALQLLF